MTSNERAIAFGVLGYILGRAQGGFHLFGGGSLFGPTSHKGMPPHPSPVVHVPDMAPPQVTTTAFHFGEERPAGLPPFPGPGWTAAHVTGSIAARAQALLHTLAMGATKYETSPDQGPIAYHKGPLHPDGTGMAVTAWRLRHPSEAVNT